MLPDLIAYAIPFFVLAIVVELLLDRAHEAKRYRFGAAVADLNAGVLSRVGDALFKGLGVALYAYVYQHFRLWSLGGPKSALAWIVGLLGIDFVYYWWHRASHHVNLLWAVHAVHHQSESFNFAVALRQPVFEWLTIVPFHLWLALVGVDTQVYVASYAINLIYQFWVHTELVGKLGPIEGVLNTPSAHRVHHAIEPEYLDRNFGGILVIWDRWFGTYVPEERRPTYGVTKPLASYDAVWANFAEFARIARLSRDAKKPSERFIAWFAHPRWALPKATSPAPAAAAFARYEPPIPAGVRRYVAVHFVLLLLAGGAFAGAAEHLDPLRLAGASAMIAASTLVLAAWTEGRSWAPAADFVRQLVVVAVVALAVGARFGALAAVGSSGAAVIALAGIAAALRPAPLRAAQG